MKRTSEAVDEAVRPKPAQMQRCQEEPCTDPVREQLMAGSSGIEKAVLMLMERVDASETKLERLEHEDQALRAHLAALEPEPLPSGVHIDGAAHFGHAWLPRLPHAVYIEMKMHGLAEMHKGRPELMAALNEALANNLLAASLVQRLGVNSGLMWWLSETGPCGVLRSWWVLLHPNQIMDMPLPTPDARAVALAAHAVVVGALNATLVNMGEEARIQECVEKARLVVHAKRVIAIRGFVRAARIMDASMYGLREEAPFAQHEPGSWDAQEEEEILGAQGMEYACITTAVDGVLLPFGAAPDELHDEEPALVGPIVQGH